MSFGVLQAAQAACAAVEKAVAEKGKKNGAVNQRFLQMKKRRLLKRDSEDEPSTRVDYMERTRGCDVPLREISTLILTKVLHTGSHSNLLSDGYVC